MGYHLTTARGYDFFEVASALQKEIRRGNEEDAMHWALELGSKFSDFLWLRLGLIASEDIGPADNSISLLLHALEDNYRRVKKKSSRPAENIILAHAIIALCRAKKSRISDDLACCVSHQIEDEGLKLAVPDYALDIHTRRGKQADRAWDHWATEGSRINNEEAGLNIYKEKALAMRRKYGRLKAKEKGPTGGHRAAVNDNLPLLREEDQP